MTKREEEVEASRARERILDGERRPAEHMRMVAEMAQVEAATLQICYKIKITVGGGGGGGGRRVCNQRS